MQVQLRSILGGQNTSLVIESKSYDWPNLVDRTTTEVIFDVCKSILGRLNSLNYIGNDKDWE